MSHVLKSGHGGAARNLAIDAASDVREARRDKSGAARTRSRRGVFMKWMRRIHAWVGLWGALVGLLFGITGILLNHRAILKIPAGKTIETGAQLALGEPPPKTAEALGALLQTQLGYTGKEPKIKIDKTRTIIWNEREVAQPEKWQISFDGPQQFTRVEYWVGNRFADVRRFDPNVFAFLTRLHMASGVDTAWVLLADSIAGSFILLALSGILLWTRMHGPKLIAAAIAISSLTLAVCFAWLAI